MIGAGRIERYVVGRTLSAVGMALAVIAAVVALVQFVDLSRTVGVRADVSVGSLFLLTCLRVPAILLMLAPFIFLFGGMGAFVGLNRSSELVAIRAAGVSAWRFIMPSAGAAMLIGILTISVLNPAAAALNARYDSLRGRLMETATTNAPRDVWLRQGDDATQIVIHARGRATVDGLVRLKDVSLFIYQRTAKGGFAFRRRLEAGEAALMSGFWRLTNVREASAGEYSLRSDTMTIRSSLDAETAMAHFASPEAIAFWRLPAAIRQTEQAGFSAAAYRLRFAQLLAAPVLFAAMSILAAAFSLRLSRLGGLSLLAGVGVGLGFLFFFLNEFSGALADAGVIPQFAAAWAPPLVALLSGLTLLCYTEDG